MLAMDAIFSMRLRIVPMIASADNDTCAYDNATADDDTTCDDN